MPYDESLGPEPTGRRRRRGIRGQWFQCSGCGKPLPIEEMGSRSSRCAPCSRQYMNDWARANRDRVRASRKRKAAEAKALAELKDRVLLRLARENPEHFAEVWEEEEVPLVTERQQVRSRRAL